MKEELEVKIQLKKGEIETLKKKVEDCGGKKEGEERKETTYGFFTPNGSSIENGIFPRIKSINNGEKAFLAVKVRRKENDNYFQRDEYETNISEVNIMRDIIKSLGFGKERIFEKIREEWTAERGEVEISFDCLPFGNFIEVEASPQQIEEWLGRLGLERRKRITRAYLAIFDDWRKENNIKEENAIFGGEE